MDYHFLGAIVACLLSLGDIPFSGRSISFLRTWLATFVLVVDAHFLPSPDLSQVSILSPLNCGFPVTDKTSYERPCGNRC